MNICYQICLKRKRLVGVGGRGTYIKMTFRFYAPRATGSSNLTKTMNCSKTAFLEINTTNKHALVYGIFTVVIRVLSSLHINLKLIHCVKTRMKEIRIKVKLEYGPVINLV